MNGNANKKVILSRLGRMPIIGRPTVMNADNNPRIVVPAVIAPAARKNVNVKRS